MNTMHTEVCIGPVPAPAHAPALSNANASEQPSPSIDPDRSSMSPLSEQLSYLDAKPCIYYMCNSPPGSGQSPYMPQLSDSNFDDYLQQDPATSFGPSLTPPDEIWDECMAWDLLQPPMAPQPTSSLQTTPGSPRVPLISEQLERPETFTPETFPVFGRASRPFAPPRRALRVNASNQVTCVNRLDTLGGFSLTSASTLAPGSAASLSDSCPLSPTSKPASTSSPNSVDLCPTTPPIPTTSLKKYKRTKPTTHNDVEKRYRTNLNAKIAELSAAVPNQRSAMASEKASGDDMDLESRLEHHRRGPPKKAMVLSRATAYIKLLEWELGKLEGQSVALKKRLAMCGRIAITEESR